MKSSAVQSFSPDVTTVVNGAGVVVKSRCTTARNAAKVDLGSPGTSSDYVATALQAAMVGWNLTPWQLQLLAGMFGHGKTPEPSSQFLCGSRGYTADQILLDEALTS
ncbi:hypothetical protein J4U02_gp073 [Mycobacterium phage Aziz]|uniref:Uncharacterized protein n=1 Tax=Mycobacterium phage Aziz TaxID=2762281 RepID=A0A7G8LHL1_9CAUD|nr:hypothetical protein J4U02_gp073 [Mycobacterium phage Aziz]ASR75920.1 hypothetical protein SEA_GENEVAB15_74 [Mycobacterium phage GenevaB15]QNJ56733.1 hypothetical protein SEA_AZIZ_73 [Mycobacterium phage Aziz]